MERQGTRSAGAPSTELTKVLVHQWFDEHVRNRPNQPALVFGKTQWTYGELDVKARRLAGHLRHFGAGPEVTVGLCLERSPELILTLLAILKSGAAYLPLDPRLPTARLRFMVQDASADLVVIGDETVPYAADLKEATHCLVALDEMDLDGPIRLPEAAKILPGHRAYVIYTSGSTGQPKGAVLEHGGLANLIRAQQELFGNGPGDRVLQFSPLSFDASLFEIVMALASGGTLVMASQDQLLPGPGLVELLREKSITHLTIPPSVLAALPDAELPDLRQIVVAGEACPSGVVRRWSSGRRFYNCYGPTEATIWSTVAVCTDDQDKPSIGQAIPGVEVHVLGPDGQPVADGDAGELCLGGVGLARGYLGRPALTARSFVPHAESSLPGERLYRTGDLVRRIPNGDLDFVGRIDHQAKIHGRRMELGEIEACLSRHRDVHACAVVVREDVPGDRRLVAYVQADAPAPAVAAWRAFLAQELPEYMVPSAFVVLETLPLTGSGKVDRDALPAPSGRRDEMGLPWVQPQGEVEIRIAELMGSLVGVDTVGAEDRFIELGGHSLLATQLAASMRDIWDVNVPLPRILEGATVAQLARMVEDGEHAAEGGDNDELPLVPMPREGRIRLSFSQERIWYVHQINPDSLAYHASSVLIFKGHLQVDGLEWALTEIVRRHELLRTGFPTLDGEPCQDIHPAQPVRLPRADLRHLPAEERSEEAERLAMDEVRRLFDIAEPPLVRWTLLELSDTEHHLVQIEHHLIHDGWSFNVLLREIVTLYRAFVDGRVNPLPELPVQFADFVLWQRQWMESEAAARQLDYWKQQLQGVPALELPTDRPRPPVQTFDGGVVPLDIPAPLATEVRNLARRQGATIFMMLFATFSALLHRWSGQRDFCIGSGVANRRQVETEPIIGMIINNLVLRVDLREDEDPDFAGFLAAMRRVTLDAYSRQDVPFDRIVEAVQPQRDASRNPLFQVAFSFHDAPLDDLDLPGVELHPRLALTAGSAKFDLNITSILPREQRVGKGDESDADGTIHMLWEYNSDLFDRPTVQRLVAAYLRFLQSAVDDPAQPLSQLPLLSAAQRHQQLVEWNDVQVPLSERLPHQLFEDQARQRGDFLALWSKDESWTYDVTNRRANHLARQLVRLGVGPEQPVALFTDGGPHLVLGMLAVLKAGGAFLPIDPSYPAERIRFLLQDSGAAVVLTRDPWIGQLPALQSPVLLLDDEAGDGDDLEANLPCRTTSRSTAYVIYTSGSTGRPKGVQVEQRGLLNLIHWHQRYYEVAAGDRMTQVSSPAFDASVWEIWPYITAGASLYFPGDDIRTSPADLVDFLQRHAIHLCYASTPLAEAMLEEPWPSYVALRTLQTAGDALSRRPKEDMTFRLVNNYGPTENTVAATYCPVAPGEALGRPSIGRPLSNVRAYVTDGNLCPVGLGSAGELLLGGLSLSRGYLDRPALTAQRFVPDPFGDEPGARLYRTGDRVRFRSNGEIDFLGRMDHQVKVRGFRIELGEVEAAVLRHPSVREAVVLVRQEAASQRLVAYVVPSIEAFDGAELQGFLRSQLPGFMVPDDVVSLSELPTTAHGKLDREALPAPRSETEAADHVAPRNEVEAQLAQFCRDLLEVPEVSVVADFFRLGGNSLLATRLVSRVNQARHIKLPLSTFLQSPTLAELAVAVQAQVDLDPAAGGEDDAIRPLARRPSQELLQRVDDMSPEEVEAMLAELQGSPTA